MRRLILCLALAGRWSLLAADDVPLEYQVKAAFLYNFTKYVEWPATARSGPVTICVAGRNPFGPALADTISGAVVDGRPLAMRVVLEPEPGCSVLFVPAGTSPAYLRAARGTPTLTVGETDDFLQHGGIIGFVHEGRNIRFAISTEAAARAGLQISSRLLRLAVNTAPGASR